MTPDETGDAECRGHYTDTVVCVGSGCNNKGALLSIAEGRLWSRCSIECG
jgi:hypothetical protein